ncbi:reverse transcriptase N-terminal domain-containing protein [Methanosarcina siciliae]|uniref:reverse transcriptase N-terminal domain-containing protein n=1 Tax=Methanosarcina siciliae TaxID=38027 RepID=UPI0028FCC69F|nr:reverse transcriptase N-terminal domain-containing protein [Methanosarcina siciliae]
MCLILKGSRLAVGVLLHERKQTYDAGYSTTPLSKRLADNSAPVKWEQINWKTVEKNVNKLQARIVKSVRQNKWHLEPIRKVLLL